MKIYVKIPFIFIFYLFLVLSHDFVIYIDFTHIHGRHLGESWGSTDPKDF